MPNMINPVSLSSSLGYHSPSSLYVIIHFFTRSFQLIISILLQHHISKLLRYLWPTFKYPVFWHNTKICSKCSTFIVSSLILSPISWCKESSPCCMLPSLWQFWISFYVYILTKQLKYFTFSSCFRSVIICTGYSGANIGFRCRSAGGKILCSAHVNWTKLWFHSLTSKLRTWNK